MTPEIKARITQIQRGASRTILQSMLCKVEGYSRKENVVIYNPARDFIRLNRALRRESNLDQDDSMKPITVPGPVLKAEVIALYK